MLFRSLQEAKSAGLRVDPVKENELLGLSGGGKYMPPNAAADPHNSLKGLWVLAEFVPKRHYNWKTRSWEHRMNLFRRRTIPEGALIHESAFQRGLEYQKLLPDRKERVSTKIP